MTDYKKTLREFDRLLEMLDVEEPKAVEQLRHAFQVMREVVVTLRGVIENRQRMPLGFVPPGQQLGDA